MRGVCPACDACVPITETGIPIGAPGKQGTATYKEITSHPDERTKRVVAGMELTDQCVGSGRRV
jgi:hypothetical protein